MALTLFRVDVQDTVFAGRQVCLVFQHLFSGEGGRHDGTDIECLFALGFSG